MNHLPGQSDLIAAAKAGDVKARNLLIEQNMGLIYNAIHKFAGREGTKDFLASGVLGFIRAVKRFDPAKGRFSTYVYWWVRGAISEQRRPERSRVERLGCTSIGLDVISIADRRLVHDYESDEFEKLAECLTDLPPRVQMVMVGRMAGRKLKSIGDDLGVSKERVRQLERDGYRAIRLRFGLSCARTNRKKGQRECSVRRLSETTEL